MKKVIVKCKVMSRDRVYVPRGYKGRSNYPRLVMRTEMHAIDESPNYLLSLRRHIEDSGVDIIEDTPITDYEGMVNIILQLGFKAYGEVSRRREELAFSENTMLYLDTLDTDDTMYAKIESEIKEKDSALLVKHELISTLRSFGETDIVESAYFEL